MRRREKRTRSRWPSLRDRIPKERRAHGKLTLELTEKNKLDHLVRRANAAAKQDRALLVTLAIVGGYVLVERFFATSPEIDLPLVHSKVPRETFFRVSSLLILIIYFAQQTYYQDLRDTIDRFARFVGHPFMVRRIPLLGTRLGTSGSDGERWEPDLPANRILDPSLVVFASFGNNPVTWFVSTIANRFLGLVVLGLLAWGRVGRSVESIAAIFGAFVSVYYVVQFLRLVADRNRLRSS